MTATSVEQEAMDGSGQTISPERRAEYAEGWHFEFRGQSVGPVSLGELSRRYGAGELLPSDRVWHPLTVRWIAMRDVVRVLGLQSGAQGLAIDPEILRRLCRTNTAVLRNSIYLASTALASLIFILLTGQIMAGSGAEVAAVIVLCLAGYLGYWAWLEYRGVRITEKRLYYASRVPFWPANAPLRPASVELPAIKTVSFTSTGNLTHTIILDTDAKKITLVFDSAFMRDLMLAVLSLHGITIIKS